MGSQDCAQATSGLRELALSLAGLSTAASGAAWTPDMAVAHERQSRGCFFCVFFCGLRVGLGVRSPRSQRALNVVLAFSALQATVQEEAQRKVTAATISFSHTSTPPQKKIKTATSNLASLFRAVWIYSTEDWPWCTTNTPFHRSAGVYSNSPCALSLDSLTNTCGRGVEGEVLAFVSVLWKGSSDSVCWQQRQVFNVAAVSLVDFH